MRRMLLSVLVLLGALGPARPQDEGPPDDAFPPDLGKLRITLDPGGHTGPIRKVLFTPDGRQLVTGAADHTIRVWDVATGEPRRVVRPPGIGDCARMDLSPDGQTVAVAARYPEGDRFLDVIYLMSLTNGQVRKVLKGHTDFILHVAFSPDGKRLASSAEDKLIRIWDVARGETVQAIPTKIGPAGNMARHAPKGKLAFSPQGDRLVYLAGGCFLVHLPTGQVTRLPQEHPSTFHGVAWAPDGTRLATTQQFKGTFAIRDIDGTVRQRPRPNDPPDAVAYDRAGRRLLVTFGPYAHYAAVHDAATGEQLSRLQTPKSQWGNAASASDGAISPDGTRAATVTSGGGAHDVFLWKTDDGSLLHRLAARSWLRPAAQIGWGPDGKRVGWFWRQERGSFHLGDLRLMPAGAADLHGPTRQQGAVTLARQDHPGQNYFERLVLKDEAVIARLRVPHRSHVPKGATLLGPDRAALSGDWGGFFLYDVASQKIIREFKGYQGIITSIAASADRRYLLTASSDQQLRVWAPDRERPLLSLYVNGEDWIVWTEEGYYAATPNAERLMGWAVDNGLDRAVSFYPAARFRNRLHRPDVIARVLDKGSVAEALKAANESKRTDFAPTSVEQLLPPRVTMEVLGRNGAQVKVRVRAEAVVKSQPVKALRLLLGGRRFADDQFTRTLGPNDDPSVVWDVTVPPGKHELRAAVDGPDTSDVSEPITVHVEPPALQKPTLYSVAVGLNYTWDDRFQPYRLGAAEGDARSLHGALQRYCAGPGNHFGRVVGEPLVGKDATTREVLNRLREVRKQGARPGDLLVLFFAGHGVAHNGTFHFLTADTDLDAIADTALSGAKLREALSAREMPCSVLLILDACQSGAAAKAFAARGLAPATDVAVPALASDETAVTVLAASRSDEYAGEQKGGGRLTRALIKGLAAGAAAGYDPYERVVYVQHLYNFAYAEVRKESQGKQNPVLLPPLTAPPLVIRQVPEETSATP